MTRQHFSRHLPAMLLVLACAGQANASAPQAFLNIDGYDANGNAIRWNENVSALITVNAAGDIAMKQGAPGDIYRNTPTDPDFWAWTTNANGNGSWNWHSSQTLSGTTASSANDPWMAVVSLERILGHGDPDLSYGFYARNNTSSTQTYTLTIGESIIPPVNSPALVYADFAAALTNPSGSLVIAPVAGHIQQFMLSNDGGASFVNAGVDVGESFSTGIIGSSSYLAKSPILNAPVSNTPAAAWNFMQIVTKFTLSPNNDIASVSGFASINAATSVPEPNSYAMLVAGLGLLGFIARRNTRHSRPY